MLRYIHYYYNHSTELVVCRRGNRKPYCTERWRVLRCKIMGQPDLPSPEVWHSQQQQADKIFPPLTLSLHTPLHFKGRTHHLWLWHWDGVVMVSMATNSCGRTITSRESRLVSSSKARGLLKCNDDGLMVVCWWMTPVCIRQCTVTRSKFVNPILGIQQSNICSDLHLTNESRQALDGSHHNHLWLKVSYSGWSHVGQQGSTLSLHGCLLLLEPTTATGCMRPWEWIGMAGCNLLSGGQESSGRNVRQQLFLKLVVYDFITGGSTLFLSKLHVVSVILLILLKVTLHLAVPRTIPPLICNKLLQYTCNIIGMLLYHPDL